MARAVGRERLAVTAPYALEFVPDDLLR